ncbi:MAG: hypothetical protein ACYTEQ_27960 [Planctomycetota bacterium]|jgi:hypothetical protein
MAKKITFNNLVVISDTHCGCKLGLCPPDGVDLDEGGHYSPSKLQKAVWAWWDEFWNEWVPMATKKQDYAVVMNGDCLDGVHHNAVTQITNNMTDQRELAIKVLAPIINSKKCVAYYHIRGTEAHVGKSGQEEEQVAKSLGAVPDAEGRHARWELWCKVGGALAHFTHHIGTTSSAAYESTAVTRELINAYTEAGQWKDQPPDFVVRSHRHRHIEVRVPNRGGEGIAFVTAGWQLKTPFVYRTGYKSSPPVCGGSIIRKGYENVYSRSKTWSLERPKVEG